MIVVSFRQSEGLKLLARSPNLGALGAGGLGAAGAEEALLMNCSRHTTRVATRD